VEEEQPKKEAQRPRFTGGGLKKLMAAQNEENADANKDIEKIQEKLKVEIKIHDKPKPRDPDQ